MDMPSWLFLSLPFLATGLHAMLSLWICQSIDGAGMLVHNMTNSSHLANHSANHHPALDHPYDVPYQLQFYFSIALGLATYARGLIGLEHYRHSNKRGKNGTIMCWLKLFVAVRSIVYAGLPFMLSEGIGSSGVPASKILVASMVLSLLSLIINITQCEINTKIFGSFFIFFTFVPAHQYFSSQYFTKVAHLMSKLFHLS